MHVQRDSQDRPRLYCYDRSQGNGCGQPSTFLSEYEAPIQELLATFHLPDDYRDQIVAMYELAQSGRDDMERRRREIENRLARIRERFGWGDISRDEYIVERDSLTLELEGLGESQDQTAVIARAAEFLRDLPSAWLKANEDQRNQMAHLLFQEIEVDENRIVSVTPQPEFAPFFVLDCRHRLKSEQVRKRRGLLPHVHPCK